MTETEARPQDEARETATRRPVVDAVSEKKRRAAAGVPVVPVVPADRLPRDREIDAAALELAKKRMLPIPPGKTLTFNEMQEWMKLLNAEMWSHVVCYLYRMHPRIIRQLKDPQAPKYIDCLTEPFDLEYITKTHGGGKFSFSVYNSDIRSGRSEPNNNKLFECDFEIPMGQHDPKLNYEELDVNHKANMAYIQLLQYRGILDGRGQVTQPTNSAPGAQAEIVKEVLNFARQTTEDKAARANADQGGLNKSVGELLLKKLEMDDPTKNLNATLAIAKELLASKPADTSMQLLIEVLKMNATQATSQQHAMESNQKTTMALFEKLLEAKRTEPNPQMEQFTQLLDFAERINGFRGGGGGRRTGWDIGLDYAQQLGVPLLNLIGNMMSLRNGRPMPPVAQPPAPGAPAPAAGTAAFDPYANPAAMRALSQTTAATQTPIQAMPPDAAAPMNQVAQVLQAYGGLVVQHLNSGTPGWQFGDWVAALMGNATHAQIAAHGEDALVQAMMSFPETAMYGEPRIRRFVQEFMNYEQFLPAEDDEETAAATPPPEVVESRPRRQAATVR